MERLFNLNRAERKLGRMAEALPHIVCGKTKLVLGGFACQVIFSVLL
jgi:hypothetical protein